MTPLCLLLSVTFLVWCCYAAVSYKFQLLAQFHPEFIEGLIPLRSNHFQRSSLPVFSLLSFALVPRPSSLVCPLSLFPRPSFFAFAIHLTPYALRCSLPLPYAAVCHRSAVLCSCDLCTCALMFLYPLSFSFSLYALRPTLSSPYYILLTLFHTRPSSIVYRLSFSLTLCSFSVPLHTAPCIRSLAVISLLLGRKRH